MTSHLKTSGFFFAAICLLLTTTSEAQQRATSDDGLTSLIVPAAWGFVDLNPAAVFQIGNHSEDAYTMVLNESKLDLTGWNITRHSMITLARILTAVGSPEVDGPEPIEVAGYPAVQYRILGESDGTRIVYLHTTIDGPQAFSQVVQWTTPSRWEENAPDLLEILESITLEANNTTKIQ
jgi:hypothetical protein